MQTAKITPTRNERIAVESPYNAEMIAEIKEIPGRNWRPTEKCWSVPTEYEDRLREIVRKYYQIEGEKSQVEMEVLRLKVTGKSSSKRSYCGGVTVDGHDLIDEMRGGLRTSPNFEVLKSEGGFVYGDGYINLKRQASHAFKVEYIVEIKVRKGAKIEATGHAEFWGSVEALDRIDESAEDDGSSSAEEKVVDFGVSEGKRLCDCSPEYLKWAASHEAAYGKDHKWVSIEAKKILEARHEIQEMKKAA